jgi:putative NADH-flavin reductase
MRIVVFGATGGTGRQLLRQALDAGHWVTAVARDPGAISLSHARLAVHRGNVLDLPTIVPHLEGADAALSALGIGYRRHATTVYSEGTANVLAAMEKAGAERLVCCSTSGLDLPPGATLAQRVMFGMILHRVLRAPYADMREMERRVRASQAAWTIVRAARLTNGEQTGRYRTGAEGALLGAWSISRADLAHYMLELVPDRTAAGTVVELAY